MQTFYVNIDNSYTGTGHVGTGTPGGYDPATDDPLSKDDFQTHIGNVLVDTTTPEPKVYHNMIEISKDDYHAIRDVGIGMYCVVVPKDQSVPTKYFTVTNLLSSEEDPNGNRYYPPDRSLII